MNGLEITPHILVQMWILIYAWNKNKYPSWSYRFYMTPIMDSWFKTLKSWSQLFHRLYYSIKLFCSLYQFWQLCFSYHIVVGYFSLSCEAGINQTENNRLDKLHRLTTTSFQIFSHVSAAPTCPSLPWNLLHYTWRALGEFSWYLIFMMETTPPSSGRGYDRN